MSEDTRNIYERIEAAKAIFPAIIKGATGQVGTRHYQYADITSVVDGVEPALTAEGVGIFPTVFNGCVRTELRVLGSTAEIPGSGALVSCEIPLPDDLTPQQVGSAITYFRRYSLVLLLNLLTEDDDGAAASTSRVTAPEVPERPVAPEAQAPAPPAAPEIPPGWDSREQASVAHKALAARINALPDDFKKPCQDFRTTHAFPYSATDFAELEEVVSVAEQFIATPFEA